MFLFLCSKQEGCSSEAGRTLKQGSGTWPQHLLAGQVRKMCTICLAVAGLLGSFWVLNLELGCRIHKYCESLFPVTPHESEAFLSVVHEDLASCISCPCHFVASGIHSTLMALLLAAVVRAAQVLTTASKWRQIRPTIESWYLPC